MIKYTLQIETASSYCDYDEELYVGTDFQRAMDVALDELRKYNGGRKTVTLGKRQFALASEVDLGELSEDEQLDVLYELTLSTLELQGESELGRTYSVEDRAVIARLFHVNNEKGVPLRWKT